MCAETCSYEEISHRDLVAECLEERSVEAWQEFVRRFQPLIAAVTAQTARLWGAQSTEIVDDLVASVYLKLCVEDCRALKECRMEHENSIFSYLKFIAASVAHDYFKKEHAKKRGGEQDLMPLDEVKEPRPAESPNKLSRNEQRLLVKDIEGILEGVTKGENSKRDQLVFWLHYRQGLTAKCISEIPALNLTQKGVESLLLRTMRSVRKELFKKKLTTKKAAAKAQGDRSSSYGV